MLKELMDEDLDDGIAEVKKNQWKFVWKLSVYNFELNINFVSNIQLK